MEKNDLSKNTSRNCTYTIKTIDRPYIYTHTVVHNVRTQTNTPTTRRIHNYTHTITSKHTTTKSYTLTLNHTNKYTRTEMRHVSIVVKYTWNQTRLLSFIQLHTQSNTNKRSSQPSSSYNQRHTQGYDRAHNRTHTQSRTHKQKSLRA